MRRYSNNMFDDQLVSGKCNVQLIERGLFPFRIRRHVVRLIIFDVLGEAAVQFLAPFREE